MGSCANIVLHSWLPSFEMEKAEVLNDDYPIGSQGFGEVKEVSIENNSDILQRNPRPKRNLLGKGFLIETTPHGSKRGPDGHIAIGI